MQIDMSVMSTFLLKLLLLLLVVVYANAEIQYQEFIVSVPFSNGFIIQHFFFKYYEFYLLIYRLKRR
jgi:hypothetical protein